VEELHTLGVPARSLKENERRLPIHPSRLGEIDADLRARMVLEEGYGRLFAVSDAELARLVGGLAPRDELFEASEVMLLPKPMHADVERMREGQVLWGWPHCVQDPELTQLAIDRKLTLIAWEAMNEWAADGAFSLHVFHKNNEMAGYCSVIHAMQLTGVTGEYGRPLSAAVIGFGATGRGAVTALEAMGVRDVSVLTRRDAPSIAAPIHSVEFVTYLREPDEAGGELRLDSEEGSFADFLAGHDIVVNCVLQDTDAPVLFVRDEDLGRYRPGSVFVDVSADEGMGFEWARPTSFENPVFDAAPGIRYYAVDHSPSLLWDSATWEIGQALAPHLRPVLEGPAGWESSETIRRAIEIRDGVVQNPRILSFQGREADYPHPVAGRP
jgi:alanine dehydrogenase